MTPVKIFDISSPNMASIRGDTCPSCVLCDYRGEPRRQDQMDWVFSPGHRTPPPLAEEPGRRAAQSICLMARGKAPIGLGHKQEVSPYLFKASFLRLKTA